MKHQSDVWYSDTLEKKSLKVQGIKAAKDRLTKELHTEEAKLKSEYQNRERAFDNELKKKQAEIDELDTELQKL